MFGVQLHLEIWVVIHEDGKDIATIFAAGEKNMDTEMAPKTESNLVRIVHFAIFKRYWLRYSSLINFASLLLLTNPFTLCHILAKEDRRILVYPS